MRPASPLSVALAAALAGAADAQDATPVATTIADAPPLRRRPPLSTFRLQASLEPMFVWRATGQLADLNQHEGDGIDMEKDLGIDRGAGTALVGVEAIWSDAAHPVRLSASFVGWGVHGHNVLPRGSWYGPGYLPAGEPTATDLYLTRATLEGAMGVAGHGDDALGGWSLDAVAGLWLWQVQWAITTVDFGTLNARLTDARVYAGVEAHLPFAEAFTLHLRAVAGNPSFLGGLGAGLDWRPGPFHAWVRLHLGSPTYMQFEMGARLAVGRGWSVGAHWIESFDQVEDGGSWQGKQNEGTTRMNHALIGATLGLEF